MKTAIAHIIFILISFQLYGQDSSETKSNGSKNFLSVEFLGASGYFSINYEREVFSIKKIRVNQSLGVGYFVETKYTPWVLSYILRTDVEYGSLEKRLYPILGYSFSHNFDLNNSKEIYISNSLVVGLRIKLNNDLSLAPKYYLMFFHEPHFNSNYILNWGGLSLKHNF